MFHNIPDELKALNQWVCWKYVTTDDGKETKLPYNPRTGHMASVTNPQTWVSFDEACNAVWNGYSGIGFVFTAFDPYCGIDLDETDKPEDYQRQLAIFEAMNSYSELSPSGHGLHIIVKAQIPHGRKRASIEIYSNERYFTFTGNVFRAAPIEDRQALTMQLWEEMGPAATPNHYQGDALPRAFDEEIITMCENAANGALFRQLWVGDWQRDYSSQSEADLALMNIIIFHTKNRAQAMRLFRMSALGQRDKAKRDKYLAYTIDKAFDETLPPIDVSGIIDQMNAAKAAANAGHVESVSQAPTHIVSSPYGEPGQSNSAHGATARHYDGFNLDLWRTVTPPLLMKQINDYIFAQAPRPVFEISLAATLGLLSGICGRAFNVEGAGLNQYIMLLAPTGRGKEAMQTGISKLIARVAANNFEAAWNVIGPADMASGPGLLKHLAERDSPCFVSITGEIGLRLQQMAMKNANGADITLAKVLLDVYGKSGAANSIRPTVYSDKKNNVDIIYAPAFTWLGESTPVEFYRGLNEQQIANGLLPRFMVIEYNGERVPYNVKHSTAIPSAELIQSLHALCHTAYSIQQEKSVVNVQFTQEARDKHTLFNQYCDHRINSMPDGPLVQLWNRAHYKMQKVAGLLAITHNMHAPVIDAQMIDWAISLVMTDVLTIMGRFERGEVGASDVRVKDSEQVELVKGLLRKFVMGELGWLSPTAIAHREKGTITYTTFAQGLKSYAVFRNDPRGAAKALEATLIEIEKIGAIAKLNGQAAAEQGIHRGVAYQVVNVDWIMQAS